MAYQYDDTLADAKLRAWASTSTSGIITDVDIVNRFINDEVQAILTARQMSAIQGHLGAEATVALVANQSRYDIPYRAAGGKIRYAAMIDSNGTRSNIRPGRPERFATTYNLTQTGDPTNCWFEDGRLVLFQTPKDSTKSLVLGIYLRPGRPQLAANATYATAAAAAGATTLSVSSVPNNATGLGGTLNGATSIDIISSKPPFQVKAYDLAVSAIATTNTTITVTATGGLPYSVAVNDWVTVTEESVAPQMPSELHPLLAARVALRILRARGDNGENAAAMEKDIQDYEANVFEFLSNRNEGQIDTMADNALLSGGKSRYGFGLGGF